MSGAVTGTTLGRMDTDLAALAPDFVARAHAVVYAALATVDGAGRPRSRVVHPFWEWDGTALVGWIATTPSPKLRHLEVVPSASCAAYDGPWVAAVADCRAVRVTDDAARTRVWELLAAAPPPVGFDPGAIGVPGWDGPTAPGFVVLRLDPWRVQVRTVGPGGVVLRTWRER
ncbi:pyridoxamine 5'-phosphate oxidase family protein [Actinomycetospora sp. C-140]